VKRLPVHLVALFLVGVLVSGLPTVTVCKTLTRDYTYHASEIDSQLSARVIALHTVTTLLMDEVAAMLDVSAEDREVSLPSDQIESLLAGLVRPRSIEQRWDGSTYWIKAQVSADPQDMEQALSRL
jgi:hypothetical protein